MFMGLGHPGRQVPVSVVARAKRPSLALDFMRPGALDSRIAFSRASSATYTDVNGIIQTATTNAPRWDYNSTTHQMRGLLIEEPRTNTFLNSANLFLSNGGPFAGTQVANAAISPDGAMTAVRIVEDTTLAQHGWLGNGPITPNTLSTASIYIKPAGNPRVYLIFINAGFTNAITVTIDLITPMLLGGVGYQGTASAGFASVTPVGNGWVRCVVGGLIDATSTIAYIGVYMDNGVGNYYTGNGTNGQFVWGAQIEAGGFATSFIPTTSVAVTRAADNASVNTLTPWYNGNAGTLYVEFMNSPDDSTECVVLSDTTPFEQIQVFTYSTIIVGFYGVKSAALQLQGGSTALDAGINKAAVNYGAPTPWKGCNKGIIFVASQSPGTAPLNATKLYIGSDGTNYLNSHIRNVSYWPRILSDAEMMQVTI